MTETHLDKIIQPMPGRVAVLVSTKDEITPNGLYIPEDTAKSIHESKPTQGRVVAIGKYSEDDDAGLEAEDPQFEVGDIVIFGKYSGTQIRYVPDKRKTAEKIVILSFKDILAKFLIAEEVENVKVKG